MKPLRVIDKLIFIVNSIAATMLLLSYILPYLEPKKFPILSVLSLAVPFLIILNLLFLFYWLLQVNKKLILSLSVLIIGFIFLSPLYKFSSSKPVNDSENISVMNYNVRLFNLFEWIPDRNVKEKISDFINEKQPDILSMQDYRFDEAMHLDGYYKFEHVSGEKIKNGQAIFSKYPIVANGSLEFPDTANNALYADIKYEGDTIRIYNLHFQSFNVIPSQVKSVRRVVRAYGKMSKTFVKQEEQVQIFDKHRKESPFRTIVCADFNNTPFSNVYGIAKGEMQDTFDEKGTGFGKTFDLKVVPFRIDFILADKTMQVMTHQNFELRFSDHYPVMTSIRLQ